MVGVSHKIQALARPFLFLSGHRRQAIIVDILRKFSVVSGFLRKTGAANLEAVE